MKTSEEIKKEIGALKAVRPKVKPYSIFGDDNLAAFDAQIDVLENNMDDGNICDKYDRTRYSEYILEGALEADNWRDGNSESDSLAEDWPLKEGNSDDS